MPTVAEVMIREYIRWYTAEYIFKLKKLIAEEKYELCTLVLEQRNKKVIDLLYFIEEDELLFIESELNKKHGFSTDDNKNLN